MAFKLFCGLSFLLVQSTLGEPVVKRFTVVSKPIFLRKGEVHNAWVKPGHMPEEFARRFANKSVHFRSLQLDIVRTSPLGRETSLPLYETYNHHHALLMGPYDDLTEVFKKENGSDPLNPHNQKAKSHAHGCMMKGTSIREMLKDLLRKHSKITAFGGASGAEFRGTNTALPAPFTYEVWSPESFMVLMHFINTRDVPHEKKLWECPCTSARKINVSNGTIDGMKPLPFQCSQQLLRENNTACSLKTYQGGYRCCEHGVFLLENPDLKGPFDKIRAKFTFEYYDEEPGSSGGQMQLRPTQRAGCCDATASGKTNNSRGFANIEYDVPKCAPGTPPEKCEHVISSVEPFDLPHHHDEHHYDPDEEMELIHAWGHQHVGAIGLELIREATGEVLCRTQPVYGKGSGPGDEAGFVVGIPPCRWGPPPHAAPPRIRRGELVRTVARYNNTEAHHGVMSLWLMQTVPVQEKAKVFV